jgi:hypothetical protein
MSGTIPPSRWRVTPTVTTTPRKDFHTSEIVGISVSREPLYLALAVVGVVSFAAHGLRTVIYPEEFIWIGAALLGALGLGASIGILHVSISAQRGTEHGRVIGPIWKLEAMRRDLRAHLSKREGV